MTEGPGEVSGGRLSIEAYVDTSGASRGLQQRINKEVAAVRAKIKAEIDTRGTIGQAKAAALAASKATTIKFKAEVDQRGLVASARKAAAEASKAAIVKVQTDVNKTSLAATVATIRAAIHDETISINVDAQVAKARAEIAALRREASRPVNMPVSGGGSNSSNNSRETADQNERVAQSSLRAASGLAKMGLMAGGIFQLVVAVGQLGGGLLAVVSSAASAAAGLAVLPNLIGVIGQSVAVMLAGFSGIGGAVEAIGAAETASAASGTAAADARKAAADRIAGAERALGDARKAAGDQARQAAEAVRDAEWSLARSIESVRDAWEAQADARRSAADAEEAASAGVASAERNLTNAQKAQAQAQENLSKARVAAKKRIDDLRTALMLARLQETAAANAVTRAQQNLADVQWNLGASPQDIAEAEQALQAAQANLAGQQAATQELASESEEANSTGVEGSEEVLAAQQDVTAAIEDEATARADLKQATKDQHRQSIDGAREIRNAEEDVRDAIHAQQEAREALADAQRAQAEGAAAAGRAVRDAQKGLADARAADVAATAAQTAEQLALNEALAGLSPAGVKFAYFLNDVLMPRLQQIKFAIQEAFLPGLQEGITRAMPLFDTLQTGLVGTAGVLGDLAIKVGTLFGSKTFNTQVAGIMEVNNKALRIFSGAIIDLIKNFANLAEAAGPTLLVPFAKWVAGIADYLEKASRAGVKSGELADFFDRVRTRAALLWDITVSLAHGLFGVGSAATHAGDELLGSFSDALDRFDKWANSDEGQKSMGKFFDATVPVTEAIGELVVNLFNLFATMSKNGVGPLTGLLFVLNNVIKALDYVLGLPGLGTLVGWLLTLSGVGGGLGLVAVMLARVGGGLATLAKLSGLAKLWSLFAKSLLATRIQLGLLWVQEKLAAAWTAILNGVMALNPFVAIGIAIVAVVAGFILLYKHSSKFRALVDFLWGSLQKLWGILMDNKQLFLLLLGPIGLVILGFKTLYNHVGWFRDIVKAAFGYVMIAVHALGDAFSWFWNLLFGHSIIPDMIAGFQYMWGIIKPIFDLWWGAVTAVGNVFGWLWDHAVKPALGFIWGAIQTLWTDFYKPILGFLWDGIKTLGNVFSWLWDNAVKPAWNSIRSAVSGAWDFIRPILTNMWQAVQTVGGWFGTLWTNVRDSWDSIKAKITAVWDALTGQGSTFAAMKDFLTGNGPNSISGWFDKAVSGIGTIWDGLKAIAKAPVVFMVDTVFNDGIRGLINAIPGVPDIDPLNIPGINAATGGILPGYTPGKDVHDFYSPTAGRLSLSGGEGILRPEATAVLGQKVIGALNSASMRGRTAVARMLGGLGGFFLGGVLPEVGATDINQHETGYSFATWAGDLNAPGDEGGNTKVVSWKPGTVTHTYLGYGDSHGRYGNHAIVQHAGQATLYAHMDRLVTAVGNSMAGGTQIGYVGDTGNADGAHLHFEVRGGTIDPGDGGAGGIKKNTEGEKQEDSWRAAISTILDKIKSFPGHLTAMKKMGAWGGYAVDMAKNIGSGVRDWLNDKIPDKIAIPGFPDIPLPANPVPELFDRGGQWLHGQMGVNLSGQTETVFTNDNMVSMTEALASTAASLRSLITGDGSATVAGVGRGPLVGELTLIGREDERQGMLRDVTQQLTLISLGGVHAGRGATGSST